MSEMYLWQPQFTCNTCRPFTKNKRRWKKIKETGDSRCIYRSKLDKACIQHDMAYRAFKDLTAADKVLPDKAFNNAKSPKYDRYQHGLPSVVYEFLDKNTSGRVVKNKFMSNQLLENLENEKYTYLL